MPGAKDRLASTFSETRDASSYPAETELTPVLDVAGFHSAAGAGLCCRILDSAEGLLPMTRRRCGGLLRGAFALRTMR